MSMFRIGALNLTDQELQLLIAACQVSRNQESTIEGSDEWMIIINKLEAERIRLDQEGA